MIRGRRGGEGKARWSKGGEGRGEGRKRGGCYSSYL